MAIGLIGISNRKVRLGVNVTVVEKGNRKMSAEKHNEIHKLSTTCPECGSFSSVRYKAIYGFDVKNPPEGYLTNCGQCGTKWRTEW